MFSLTSLKKRKLEIESELELAQVKYEEARHEEINFKQKTEEVDKTITLLKEKLDTEKRAAEKRRQLLSLLGPNSNENQEKVFFLRAYSCFKYYFYYIKKSFFFYLPN